ncbi:MAG: hydrogenase maturation peptidase HycI [Candidatus Omnitrophica bacterium]|jgi:hydrogenase 3 maturation protease|nr:hydrogenase maturation peptidase HycI [Candidatus Omnitrophota bacterium]
MQSLINQLTNKLANAKRIVVLGVGSELRSDDAAGLIAARTIQKKVSKSKKPQVAVLLGETAPENFTGEIKKLKPTHLIIIDAADISKKSGDVVLFNPEDIKGISFCTHQLPMSIMIDYLKNYINCDVSIIGIQPKSLRVGNNLSKEVKIAVKCVSDAVLGAIYTSK